MEKKIFLKNNDYQKEFSINEFKAWIKDLFESSRVNFLIGSGYSIEKLGILGNIEELSVMIEQKYGNEDKKKFIAMSFLYYNFFLKCIFPAKEDIKNERSFINSDNFIYNLKLMLDKRQDKNLPKKINIFTTNYDMYFELSMEEKGIYYNDGFNGKLKSKFNTYNFNNFMKKLSIINEKESQVSNINLHKIHGSLSWKLKNNEIEYNKNIDTNLDDIFEKSTIFRSDIFSNENISLEEKINGIDLLEIEKIDDFYNLSQVFIEGYNKLQIINPTKRKFEETLLNNIYYDILRIYSIELEKFNNVLFVFGFSFSDEHIKTITDRTLQNQTMSMYVFIYKKISSTGLDMVKKYIDMFESQKNVHFIYFENDEISLSNLNDIMFGDI